MRDIETFTTHINQGYQFKSPSIDLGAAMLSDQVVPEAKVRILLKTLNRHGLITGATGTGKTKTLQILAEQFAASGISSLLMDIKGDLSGVAVPAVPNARIEERHAIIDIPFIPSGSTVEFLSLSDQPGVRLRATVTEFGPILFAKILSLNDTQSSLLSVLFKYCDDHSLPLIDLNDIKSILNYIQGDGKEEFENSYGKISTTSLGVILRRIIELESQGASQFFGEPSFEVEDLCKLDNGKGILSVLRLVDLQDRPKLFSTFMLQLLGEIYSTFPEVGDLEKPKLIVFIDEAHLVFQEASKALLNQIETIIRLVRSKGVGIIFCTQSPTDIPDAVLGQLGLKIQHSLRAFTAKDRRAIKQSAENFPLSNYYDISDVITRLGVGEALVTSLDEKGRPTPLAHTMLRAPVSRMDILNDLEIAGIISKSRLISKYNRTVDKESATDLLNEKIKKLDQMESTTQMAPPRRSNTTVPENRPSTRTNQPANNRNRREKTTVDKVLDNPLTKQIGRTLTREITRGLMGLLTGKKR